MPAPLPWPRVLLGGTPVDLLDTGGAVDTVVGHATRGAGWPLGVMSANLDHIHHFGYHGPSSLVPFAWAHPGAGDPYPGGPPATDPLDGRPPVRWLNLLDGAPLVRRAEHLTGHAWPRLAGRDLIAPVLDHGWEWAWRLAHEPRRLARRYLLDGPPAYDVLARRSFVLVPGAPEAVARP